MKVKVSQGKKNWFVFKNIKKVKWIWQQLHKAMLWEFFPLLLLLKVPETESIQLFGYWK